MALLLAAALAMGAGADFAIRLVGFKLPPIFTVTWGGGALFLIVRSTLKIREKFRQDAATTYQFGVSDLHSTEEEAIIRKSAA